MEAARRRSSSTRSDARLISAAALLRRQTHLSCVSKVVVSVVNEKCRIDTELLPSLFLRCTTDPLRRDKYPAVTHLKFLTRENSEQVTMTTK